MDISAIILSACLHKDNSKQSLCVDTATKCISREVNNELEVCIEEGKVAINKSCFDNLEKELNLPASQIAHNISKCNDIILDKLMRIKVKYYKSIGDKMTLEEKIEREWLATDCQKVSRALTLYCKENTFGKVGHN